MDWASQEIVSPTSLAVVIVYFLLLVLYAFLYWVGECYQSGLLMRIALAFSALIVSALTATCCLALVIDSSRRLLR